MSAISFSYVHAPISSAKNHLRSPKQAEQLTHAVIQQTTSPLETQVPYNKHRECHILAVWILTCAGAELDA